MGWRTTALIDFYSFTREQLQNHFVTSRGDSVSIAKLRAGTLMKRVYRSNVSLFDETVHQDGFSIDFYKWLKLNVNFSFNVQLSEFQRSDSDGTVKFALRLSDGSLIETVLIPERGRLTLCLSTQVGCAQACRFCQTGRMGLKRSLTTQEIVSQVVFVSQWLFQMRNGSQTLADSDWLSQIIGDSPISNLVFMGMGEPLDNLSAVLPAISIFTDAKGLNLSPRKITVSTVGILPELEIILNQTNVSLALSLHFPFDKERSKVMPVNQRFPLADVLEVLKRNIKRGPYFIQYTLIKGVNDTSEHAAALTEILKEIPVKVNLIPLNEHDGAAFRRPDLSSVVRFQNILKSNGLVTTVRLSKGRDVQAACGQLIQKVQQNKQDSIAVI